jgi:hypothetical protein
MGAMLSGLKRFQKAGALHFKTLSSFHRIATLDYFFNSMAPVLHSFLKLRRSEIGKRKSSALS